MEKQYAIYGENKTIKEWVKDPRCEISEYTFRDRIKKSYPFESILENKKHNKKGKANIPNLKEELEELRSKKKNITEISEIFGVRYETVCKWLKEFNIPATDQIDFYFLPKIGHEFNRLTFLKEIRLGEGLHNIRWLCECKCGTKKLHRAYSVYTNRSKSCGCLGKEVVSNKMWAGCGEISKTYIGVIKRGGEQRGWEFKTSIEELWDLFLKQNRKCALSGQQIKFSRHVKEEQTASLDRINSNKDYTLDNVQWVHKDINMAKQKMNNEEFIKMCEMVVKNVSPK